MIFRNIERLYAELVWQIRMLCWFQRANWRQVPYVLLQARTPSSWAPHYDVCVRHGYYRVNSGETPLWVDCATGELVVLEYAGMASPAPDSLVVRLAGTPTCADAASVLRALSSDMELHRHDPLPLRTEAQAWRTQLLMETGLQPEFSR